MPNGNSVSLSYASTGDEPALTANGRSTCRKCRTCSRCESKWTAFENVGVPGMLDGRLRDEDGRSAGRTNSPDFFRSIGGLLSLDLSDSSSSVMVSSSEVVVGVSACCFCRKSINTDSVFDLLCPILRNVSAVGVSTSAVIVKSLSAGMTNVNAWFVLAASPCPRFGELSLLCSIILIAACSSAKFSSDRPVCALVSSSSLEFCAESGGEITACVGIFESFEPGGGDCRILVDEANMR